jgi:hypothetical protein
MKLRMTLTLAVAVFSLGVLPVTAGAVTYAPDYQPDHPTTPKGPKTAPKGKAYGYYCRGESKKHVKGEKGTAFSRCVKRMRLADSHENMKPKKACKGLSKKHVKGGEKGTEFSRCIKKVNEMRKDEAAAVATTSVA